MKKFFYISVIALVFASCSTDNDAMLLQEEAVVVSTIDEFNEKMSGTTTTTCISFLYGSAVVDVSQGINNPQVIFTADVPNGNASRPSKYTISLELQALSDCEDLNSGTGSLTRHSLYNFSIPAVSDPGFTLTLGQLPSTCYRWRFVVEGYKVTSTGSTPCVTTSIWYDAPLF